MVGSPYYNIKFIGAIDCKSLSSLLPLPPQHTDMWKLLCSAHISSCYTTHKGQQLNFSAAQ